MLLRQIGHDNVSVQEPLNQAIKSIVKAIQMGSQAATAPQQQPSAPPQG